MSTSPDLSARGYDGVARLFHWLVALLIFVMFGLGWYMADLELTDPSKFRLYQIHKSIGILIFVLALLRLAWRLTHEPPSYPSTMRGWERFAASGAHWALYALILLQPVLGVLQSNAANFPIVLLGRVELPALIGPDQALGETLLGAHHLLANVLAGLALLHIGAALRHHVMLKDDVLRRMLPGAGLGVAVLCLTLALAVPPFLLAESERTTVTAPAEPSSSASAAGPSAAERAGAEIGPAWEVAAESKLGFIARQLGSPVPGSFDSFDAEIIFDPADLENSRLDVDIDVTSISTGHSDRDKTLNSPSFFDTATWPTARFESDRIMAKGDDLYEAAGTLTIRDVTKDVVLPFTLEIGPEDGEPTLERAHAVGELPILRLDYGVGQGEWSSTKSVADEVVITIDIKASRPAEG